MEQQPGLAAGVKDYVSRRTPRSSSDNDFSGITTDMPLHASESMQEEVIPKPLATNADLTSIDLEGMDGEVKEKHENADAQV